MGDGNGDSRRNGRLRLFGEVHRSAAAGRGAHGGHIDQLVVASPSVRRPNQSPSFPFRPAERLGRTIEGSGGPLQHLLGAIQSPLVHACGGGAELAGALRGRTERGGRTRRTREHHQSLGGFALGVLPRQSDRGKSDQGFGAVLRDPPAGGAVWQRRHPDQQHCVGVTAVAGLWHIRRRSLSTAADLCGRSRPTGRRSRERIGRT